MNTKTIFLLRHGKADWGINEGNDINRFVIPEGISRTEHVAAYLKEINVKIDIIVSSPAKRAIQTATIIKNALNLPDIIIENRLYPCSGDGIFNLIIEQDDRINSILIVGHNPGLSYFATEYMNPDIDNIPTSGLISCKYHTESWSEFIMVERKVNFVFTPKKA